MAPTRRRAILAGILIGNAVAFAGVDPPLEAATALLAVLLAADAWDLAGLDRWTLRGGTLLAGLALLQLIPAPAAARALIQPGLAPFTPPGWWTLSVAPWATVEAAAAFVVLAILAVAAARIAATRTGPPFILTLLAATGLLTAILGLATEGGLPGRVLLVRVNSLGGSPYGPFVNRNHFALALELTIPATAAILAMAARRLVVPGEGRRPAAVTVLAAGLAVTIQLAALIRCGSRGGVVFLLLGGLASLPLWRRGRPGRRWSWVAGGAIILVAAGVLAFNRIGALHDRFNELLVINGVSGNTRLDLWRGTLALAARSPLTGCGLGAYRYAIGLDKPPTGALRLEQAHNDWLELAADGGAAGLAAALLLVAGLAAALRPGRIRRLRFTARYPAAAAAFALAACALHELVGFGLQTPLNAYLAATWAGLVWGFRDPRGAAPAAARPGDAGGDSP